jgi:calcineurin-like phosphoesterase family protein
MSTFVCSDLHLGHESMVRNWRTQFNDIWHHDESIIDNWNSVVNKRDKVFVLGDVTMETRKHYYLLDQLNGFKTLIGGNHDLAKDSSELLKYFDQIAGMVKYKEYWLTHAPIHPDELRGKKNIHGHIHNRFVMLDGKKDKRYINVSMDVIGFTPQKIDEL